MTRINLYDESVKIVLRDDTNTTDTNTTDTNGTDTNGTDTNGTDTNGTDTNGTDTNGTDTNTTNGSTDSNTTAYPIVLYYDFSAAADIYYLENSTTLVSNN